VSPFLVALVALSAGCFVVGLGCLYLVHCRDRVLALWGRLLFVPVLFGLASAGLLAAWHRSDALAPVGLLSGLLVVAMLWESPAAELETPNRS
jgi:hypothetical protein